MVWKPFHKSGIDGIVGGSLCATAACVVRFRIKVCPSPSCECFVQGFVTGVGFGKVPLSWWLVFAVPWLQPAPKIDTRSLQWLSNRHLSVPRTGTHFELKVSCQRSTTACLVCKALSLAFPVLVPQLSDQGFLRNASTVTDYNMFLPAPPT